MTRPAGEAGLAAMMMWQCMAFAWPAETFLFPRLLSSVDLANLKKLSWRVNVSTHFV